MTSADPNTDINIKSTSIYSYFWGSDFIKVFKFLEFIWLNDEPNFSDVCQPGTYLNDSIVSFENY
jgi:hypothetical protein